MVLRVKEKMMEEGVDVEVGISTTTMSRAENRI
jgi:hypothetical protein